MEYQQPRQDCDLDQLRELSLNPCARLCDFGRNVTLRSKVRDWQAGIGSGSLACAQTATASRTRLRASFGPPQLRVPSRSQKADLGVDVDQSVNSVRDSGTFCIAGSRIRPPWVKLRRTQCEQMSSGSPLKADIAQCSRHVSNVPRAAVSTCNNAHHHQQQKKTRHAGRKGAGGLSTRTLRAFQTRQLVSA
jgi:hypothetical protein